MLAGLGFLGGLTEIPMDDVGLQEIAVFEGLSEIPVDAVGLKDMLADVVGLVVDILFERLNGEGLVLEAIGLIVAVPSRLSAQSSPGSESLSKSSLSGSMSTVPRSSSQSCSSRLEIPGVFGFPASHDLHTSLR